MLIAVRDNGYRAKDEERIVLDTVGRYRTAMAQFAAMNNLEVWYSRLEIESMIEELAPHYAVAGERSSSIAVSCWSSSG